VIFALVVVLLTETKSIEVHFTDRAPVIDGVIEEVWQSADSAYDFIQYMPYEKEGPSDLSEVYLLQDASNLYVAFRCWTKNIKPTTQLGGNEDFVVIYIDPFGSKTTAYYFRTAISGCYNDGWILDDARSSDDSWDGVWYRAVKVFDDRYEVEIKIPFKSIRYKKGLSEWGINFKRYICAKQETDYWTEVLQVEGSLVSKYGSLKGINPQATGYYFEIYPEGFFRSDKTKNEMTELKFSGSLNLKWDITPQTTLNATAFPDFAQIESDPFTLNLSQYETYLDERRPFFLEGKEIFRMSDFGEGKGFFTPLRIFYSRRIGKSINSEIVPILGGLKLSGKSKEWSMGVFGAITAPVWDSVATDSMIDPPPIEPERGFGVFRLKRKVFESSDIGLLFSGSAVNSDTYNYGIGLDGVYRSGPNQFILQTALSDKIEKRGWAFSSGYFGFIKNFLTMGGAEVVHDSFDVSDIGYVPWAGLKKFLFFTGPFKMYPKGVLRNLWVGPGIAVIQEPGDTIDWSKLVFFVFNPNFRNNWGFNLEFSGGPYYEADTNYLHRGINFSVWGNGTKYDLWFGGNFSYSYNYYRDYLAYQGYTWHGFEYNIFPRLSLSFESNSWIEWDITDTILAITPMATPRIEFTITPTMSVSFFNEFVFSTPGTDFGDTEFLTNRLGFLFSYNFRPKSWLYIALNDYREISDTSGLPAKNRVGAIKTKYLIYF